ncbi:hypothetical protein [Pseudalkalibacillus berkeleyi]|uniref:DUF4083 domain-containing protein n=1 Tax=Pseudalkalibacillus berkeleyi TaxID=1069813 RepID=A0ABS9GXV9_9BACL|nr:hypothetical protein [Pseudalkalibacillus berkeleyi]MCF6136328.1 hypothetical protein [Pseudalkalibacillus berkeleyi]
MSVFLIIGIGMIVLLLFIISIFSMITYRISSSKHKQNGEVAKLRKRVEALEDKIGNS